MGFDFKDIADIIPFILENLSNCAYIIAISIFLGFLIGKVLERVRQKKKISELESKLVDKEEALSRINQEKEILKKEVNELNVECEILKRRIETVGNNLANSQFISLSSLERMLDSKEGKVELTALIELNYKKNKG